MTKSQCLIKTAKVLIQIVSVIHCSKTLYSSLEKGNSTKERKKERKKEGNGQSQSNWLQAILNFCHPPIGLDLFFNLSMIKWGM